MGSLHHKGGWGTAYGSIDQDGSYRAVEYTGYVWNFDGGDTTQIGGPQQETAEKFCLLCGL